MKKKRVTYVCRGVEWKAFSSGVRVWKPEGFLVAANKDLRFPKARWRKGCSGVQCPLNQSAWLHRTGQQGKLQNPNSPLAQYPAPWKLTENPHAKASAPFREWGPSRLWAIVGTVRCRPSLAPKPEGTAVPGVVLVSPPCSCSAAHPPVESGQRGTAPGSAPGNSPAAPGRE